MKFKIRAGFSCPVVNRDVTTTEDGKEFFTFSTTMYFAGKEIELDEEQASHHLHKLEPLDAAAKKFCLDAIPVKPEPVGAPQFDLAQITALVEAQVTARMAALTPAAK